MQNPCSQTSSSSETALSYHHSRLQLTPNPCERSTVGCMPRHLAALRESKFLPPFTRAGMSCFTPKMKYREITSCTPPSWGHHTALFSQYRRIGLVRYSSKSAAPCPNSYYRECGQPVALAQQVHRSIYGAAMWGHCGPTLVGTALDIKYLHWISSTLRFDVKYDIQSGVL